MMVPRCLRILAALTAALVLAGLFVRPEEGPDAILLFYPIVAFAAVVVVVIAVRLLRGLLERDRDYYDAD